MNTTDTQEAEVVTPAKDGMRSLVLRDSHPLETTEAKPPATPQQMRVMEVSQALEPAYARASTLELTDGEIDQLMAPFPDGIVDIRPHDGLIYISHIHISNRLNRIFKPGKWSLICRRHWLEGSTMYGEYVLLIRGCFVGESIGGHPYVASNPKTNYSDALEATAGEALRRICGKRLSCGSQVWEPDYAKHWVATFAHKRGNSWYKNTKLNGQAPAQKPPEPVPAPRDAVSDPGRAAAADLAIEEEQAAEAMGKALKGVQDKQEVATGILEKLAFKPTKKGGTRYGVMLDGERWFNHFDGKVQEDCESLKGHRVIVHYVETQYGKDLKSIDPEDA